MSLLTAANPAARGQASPFVLRWANEDRRVSMTTHESEDAAAARGRITENGAEPRDARTGKRAARRIVLVVLLAVAILTAISGSYLLLVLTGLIIVLFGTATGFAFLISRRRDGSGGLLWTGLVSFDENDFGDTERFPDLRRSRGRSAGRKGLTGGRLRVKKSGVYWEAGSILTPGGQLHGSFIIPWPTIASVDVSDIPNNFNALGGAIRFYFSGEDQHIYGEYLGSRMGLMHGLLQSPLGSNEQVK